MLLFREDAQDYNFIVEKADDGKKSFFIEGVFLQGNIKNKNGRIYPMEVLEKEVDRYRKEAIIPKRALGELGHPEGPAINLDRVSHIITELTKSGTNFIGKAKIASTPMGEIAKNLIQDGVKLGVSSRGMGSMKVIKGIQEVQKDFRLATAADIVANPSAPDAFIKGILEGVEWWYDLADCSWKSSELVENQVKTLKKMTKEKITSVQTRMFEAFINSLDV